MGYFTHVMFLLEMSLNLVSMFEVVPPPWTPSSDGGRFLIFSFYNQSINPRRGCHLAVVTGLEYLKDPFSYAGEDFLQKVQPCQIGRRGEM